MSKEKDPRLARQQANERHKQWRLKNPEKWKVIAAKSRQKRKVNSLQKINLTFT